MASRIAYRSKWPDWDVLHFPIRGSSKGTKGLYKAPPTKASRTNRRSRTLTSRLPLEIIHLVLLNLDLTSLGMLRRVDTTSRQLVESLPAYVLLRKHVSDTLRIMDATKCTSYFPIQWIYTEFCHPWCRTCGDFGPYLYLPRIKRICYNCCFIRPAYCLLSVENACLKFSLSQKNTRSLPIIHNMHTPRHRWVDWGEAMVLGKQVHGSYSAMKEAFQTRLSKRERSYQRQKKLWHKKIREGNFCPGPQRPVHSVPDYHGDPLGIEATAAFPYWDRQTQTLESGTFCLACTVSWFEKLESGRWLGDRQDVLAYGRAFLEADLPEHFLHCEAVKGDADYQSKMGLYAHRICFVVEPRTTTAG